MPSRSEVVLIAGAALMVMYRVFSAVRPTLSVTRMVKLEVPAVVDVPVIAPVEESSDSPLGKAPELTDQV